MINSVGVKSIQIEFFGLQMIEIALYIVHAIKVLDRNVEL